MNKYKFTILEELTDDITSQWKLLWETSKEKSFFNSYEWFLVCLKTYNVSKFKIYCFYKDGALVGIFPGIYKKQFGIVAFSSPSSDAHTPNPPILLNNHDPKLVAFVFNTISQQDNLFVSHSSKSLAKVVRELDKKTLVSAIAKNDQIDLSLDLNTVFKHSVISDIQKVISKNENLLKYELIQPTTSDASMHMKRMIDIDQKSAKKIRGGDTFSEKDSIKLFTNLLHYCNKHIQIGYLYYNSEPIAYLFNFAFDQIMAEFLTAYLADYSKLSPGKVLLYMLMSDIQKKSFRILRLGMSFTGLNPAMELQYDIYVSRNIFVRTWWKLINKVRRLNQVLFCRDFFKDYMFLFKESI